MRSIFLILLSIGAGYFVLVLLMYYMQSSFIYFPEKKLGANPSSLGLRYENVKFKTEDDVVLHGWFVPCDCSDMTVLYFHGNAGNISGRLPTVQLLNDLGLNVFLFDYRGYGESEGRPSEQGTYRDGLAAWEYLTSNRQIADSSIVIMGRSLGGSVAAWLSARKIPAASVIESTFTSAAELGSDLYPWLPVRWIIKYDYNTFDSLRQINSPIFMAHSRDDQIVPFHHGKQLFKAANDPKKFIELTGAHGTGFWETGSRYRSALQEFLKEYTSYHNCRE